MTRVFLIFLLLLFAGCSKHQEVASILKKDPLYSEALRNTQKGDIVLSLENRAQIIATYLNNIDKKYTDETFFVRVYIDNDFEDENRSGLYNPDFNLTLNSQKPLKIEPLSKESPLVKKMPFTQPWYHYYLVSFKQSDKKRLNLKFQNRVAGTVTLTFEKND